MRRLFAALPIAALFASLAACGAPATTDQPDYPTLGEVSSGSTVYIDGWADSNKRGDRALVEQKKNCQWVVPADAETRPTKGGGFDVKITVAGSSNSKVYALTELNDTQVGVDHDRGVAADERVVEMKASGLKTEPGAKLCRGR